MSTLNKNEGLLSPYRILDLTDEKGLLCGKLLGDLGADVIKIERPGGDPARYIGPFYHDEVDPEKSLFWLAYNVNKRGITLDIESGEGKDTFIELVKTADIIIESFPPGYMDGLGLGYSALEKINPGVILVSISPFGQTGPYKDYKGPDIVTWAMSGQMHSLGLPERPPIRISHHAQSHLQGAASGAFGAMIALIHKQATQEGQQVDVSMQMAAVQLISAASWDTLKRVVPRGANLNARSPRMWPCADGYVLWYLYGGAMAKRMNRPVVKWMESEGESNAWLSELDWDEFDLTKATQDYVNRLCEPIAAFFKKRTKAELLEGAVKHRSVLYPVSTVADITQSVQLKARKFWVDIKHPELGATISYPGSFAQAGAMSPRVKNRAPHIGEHNAEVFHEVQQSRENELTVGLQKERKISPERPLEGIRVADFTSYAAAPLATKVFANFGAEVIKVEGETRPDPWRTYGPFRDNIPGINRSVSFNQINAGKRSVSINLKNAGGVEIAKRIVAKSDIVVENYAGGVMSSLGLGYEELRKVKPDIIMISSCMQGQTGPHATHPGFGPHLTALSGFCHITGWPDGPPSEIGVYTDLICPYFIGLSAIAALDYRRRTGKGLFFDMAQYENAIHYLAPLLLDYQVNQRIPGRMGNSHSYAAPHGAYRCLDEKRLGRWCTIAVFTEEEWRSFKGVIGNPFWADDPKFATLSERLKNEEELNHLVEKWTTQYAAEEVMTRMQAAGVPAGLVENSKDQFVNDPQLKHRKALCPVEHPEIGTYYVQAPSFRLSKSEYVLESAPLLGADNEVVLSELLGLSDDEISDLVIAGAIE